MQSKVITDGWVELNCSSCGNFIQGLLPVKCSCGMECVAVHQVILETVVNQPKFSSFISGLKS